MKSSQTPTFHAIRNDFQNIYVSLKNLCRADERKNLLFHFCFFSVFFHIRNFEKIGIDTHPIDLSCHRAPGCHQKF